MNQSEVARVAVNALVKFKSSEAHNAINYLAKHLNDEQLKYEISQALSKRK